MNQQETIDYLTAQIKDMVTHVEECQKKCTPLADQLRALDDESQKYIRTINQLSTALDVVKQMPEKEQVDWFDSLSIA